MSLPVTPSKPPDEFKVRVGTWLEATASGRFAIIIIAAAVVVVIAVTWLLLGA